MRELNSEDLNFLHIFFDAMLKAGVFANIRQIGDFVARYPAEDGDGQTDLSKAVVEFFQADGALDQPVLAAIDKAFDDVPASYDEHRLFWDVFDRFRSNEGFLNDPAIASFLGEHGREARKIGALAVYLPSKPAADEDVQEAPAEEQSEKLPDYLVEYRGYWAIKDGSTLKPEPEIEDSIDEYIESVDKAFKSEYPVHPNLEMNRNHDQLIFHAYDLDYRIEERRRIRKILPADADVFELINHFADKILGENLERYLNNRREAFYKLSKSVWLAYGLALALGLSVMALPWVAPGLAGAVAAWLEPSIAGAGVLFGSLAAAAGLFFLLGYVLPRPFYWFWRDQIINKGLIYSHRQYESNVRDAAGSLQNAITTLQSEISDRTEKLARHLSTMGGGQMNRLNDSRNYMRLLLWFPERLGLIENYYRGAIDQFVRRSALKVLDADGGTHARRELRRYMRNALAAGLLALYLGVTLPDHVRHLVMFSPLLILAAGLGYRFWPYWRTQSGLKFIPKQPTLIERDLRRRRGLGMIIGAAPAVLLAFLSLVVPWLVDNAGLVLLTYACAGGAAAGCLAFDTFIIHDVYVEKAKNLSANVSNVVVSKMENTFNAYSKIRIDQKIADVYVAVFEEMERYRNFAIKQQGGSNS